MHAVSPLYEYDLHSYTESPRPKLKFYFLSIIRRYARRNIAEEGRSGHVVCNVWGWVTLHGVGDVFRIEGRFNSANYINMLEERFLPSLREKDFPFTGRPLLFIHDKCPIHTAHTVQRWFEAQDDLQLLDWPSKGADMNVTEHVWAHMVNTWDPSFERTPEQLMEHVKVKWTYYRNRPDLIRNLVLSMPSRFESVIEKDGGWTRY